jgi:hypothetical protein
VRIDVVDNIRNLTSSVAPQANPVQRSMFVRWRASVQDLAGTKFVLAATASVLHFHA